LRTFGPNREAAIPLAMRPGVHSSTLLLLRGCASGVKRAYVDDGLSLGLRDEGHEEIVHHGRHAIVAELDDAALPEEKVAVQYVREELQMADGEV
jgi:hypothetical protein